MKVTNPNLSYLKNQQAAQSEKAEQASKAKNGATPSGAEGIDRIAISELGQLIVQTIQEMDRQEDIDEARVERMRALIDSGEYKVDSQKLAASILREHLS